MSHHEKTVVIEVLASPLRIDKYVADTLALFPRSQWERRNVETILGQKSVKASVKLVGGETLTVRWSDLPEITLEAENIPLDVLYEDASCVVINKPRGMVVHPAQGNWTGTVVQALLHHVQDLEDAFESDVRPGIVHRLDKDTTGVLMTAKTPSALEALSRQFRDRTTKKTYYAVLKGVLKPNTGTLEGFLGRDPQNRQKFAVVPEGHGKLATTEWRVVATVPGYTLVEFRPLTGRTHQLRVHALALKCPILGDPVYARPDPHHRDAPLMLHAARLSISLREEEEPRVFSAPLPEDYRKVLKNLGLPDPLTSSPD